MISLNCNRRCKNLIFWNQNRKRLERTVIRTKSTYTSSRNKAVMLNLVLMTSINTMKSSTGDSEISTAILKRDLKVLILSWNEYLNWQKQLRICGRQGRPETNCWYSKKMLPLTFWEMLTLTCSKAHSRIRQKGKKKKIQWRIRKFSKSIRILMHSGRNSKSSTGRLWSL